MSKDMIRPLRALCFFLLLAFVLFNLQDLVTPNKDWPEYNRRTTKNIRSVFLEKPNSLDYLCVGSSFMFRGWSPMEVYRQSGLRGYVMGDVGQRAPVACQLLKTVMKQQTPRFVFADMGSLFKTKKKNQNSVAWQSSLDGLPYTRIADRLDMARAMASIKGRPFDKEFLERAALPLMLYHSNYLLNEYDFLDLHLDQVYHRKGYVAQSRVNPSPNVTGPLEARSTDEAMEPEDDEEDEDLNDDELEKAARGNRTYYEEILRLCQSRGCEFVMVKIPMNTSKTYSSHWTKQKHDIVQRLADEMGVRFIDLNDIDVGLDWTKDTGDRGKHLNLAGATKVSAYMAEWMQENCDATPVKDDQLDAQWDYQLRLYDAEMEFFKLQMEGDLLTFLERVREGGYTLLVASSGGAGRYWTDDIQSAFMAVTGSDFDPRSSGSSAFVAIARGGKLMGEKCDAAKCIHSGTLEGGAHYSLASSSGKDDDRGRIKVDGRLMSCKGVGMHFVVYSDELNCVVDSVSFNPFEDGCPAVRDNVDYTNAFRISLIDFASDYLKKM